ncbi:hypothetical protein D4764_07G0003300 [Takifugu flavidus]|uniref:PiggyBac transposable element-derived protein domain-containing protein n=1 Tax=Takifugu flavidus TaxID=433684 RepID=A0A5C6MTX9_9TELE|nr:hypothetical protein D4764_07G0003300 [Takifugu flavidus]
MDGDTSELDLSDNDDDILDASYQPQPQEQSSSTEDESSGDEYPSHIPLNRAGDVNVSVAKIMIHTPRSSCRTRHEADGSNDGPEEPTTGPSPNPKQGQSYKDGIVLDFDLYQGSAALREQVEEPEGLGLGSLVMARLCKTLHRGTKVYCDWLFTSIQGAEQMLKKELYLTDLALANSWLLYRKDLATCGAPRKSIMQFLEFRMDVARTFLAQHHSQEEDADSPELSEGDDDSSESKKRPVLAVPHVSVRRRANAHLPEMVNMKNAAEQQAAQGEPECVA